jgi:hypothetical protein
MVSHFPQPRCFTPRRGGCLQQVDVRWTAWLAIAWLSLGCSKAVVMQNVRPDASSRDRADAGVDATVQVRVSIDVQPSDAAPAQGDGACSRSVSLRGVSIARPVPFDVVIVADNSDSLSWSRDSLSAGLKNLLSRVHGQEARFFVLTTTQYGASSQAAVSPITGEDVVMWRDSASGAPYLNAMTTYSQQCADGRGAAMTCPKPSDTHTGSWTGKGTWQFQMPAAVASITADMDDAELAVQQKRIADAVLALGGGGSQQEQPICTLLRYIGQGSTALPKHAVFVVLSDEDDTSPPDACLAGFDANQQVGTGAEVLCDSNCPSYVYVAEKPDDVFHLDYSCVPVDDKGIAHPENATKKSMVAAPCPDGCTETTRACTERAIAMAIPCETGNVIQSCTCTCVVGGANEQCPLRRPDNKTDICTKPFDEGGVHYKNLFDYCSRDGNTGWKSCRVVGLKPDDSSTTYAEHTTPLVTAKNTAEMIQTFKTTADRQIGKGNYSIEAIVLDPAFSCPLNSGQSYAPNLRSLASGGSDVFAFCQDYAPAIERIASFADYLIQTTFPLDLDEYEAVDSVVVTNKSGGQRTVAATSYVYDRAAQLLRFDPGVLTAQDDSLAVNIARYCQSVIP